MKRCKNILVIEDDLIIQETLRDILELEGYTTHTASNGKEALELLSQISRPCVILLDLMMPVMTGWEFIEEKKKIENFAPIPVVIVSAAGDEKIKTTLSAQDYIRKPFDMNSLSKAISKYCGDPL